MSIGKGFEKHVVIVQAADVPHQAANTLVSGLSGVA